jgi:flotillin
MESLLNEVDWIYLMAPVAAVAGFFLLLNIVRSFLYICEPNQVLVISGRRHKSKDGRDVGFRVVTGGRAWRIPLVEKVIHLDVSALPVTMKVEGAYSDGGIPLTVQAVANVKVATSPESLGNAIERFLGKAQSEIAHVAKETLEGHLRGVLAAMTPEEVNESRLKFAEKLGDEASADLKKLGIQLDLLKIQAVSDDRNYLDSIGRKRIAEIAREAEVAESDAMRAAEQAEAVASARAGVAVARAQAAIEQRRNELRRVRAELESEARSAEERAQQAALAARAQAEQGLQTLRADLERLRLEADVRIPAEVDQAVSALEAEGHAAATTEQGRAVAEAMRAVAEAWRVAGPSAMTYVLAQQLGTVVSRVNEAASAVHGSEVTVVDAGDGKTLAIPSRAHARAVVGLLEELKTTLGIDIGALLRGETPPRLVATARTDAPSL